MIFTLAPAFFTTINTGESTGKYSNLMVSLFSSRHILGTLKYGDIVLYGHILYLPNLFGISFK